MATHSSILVYRIPWTQEPGRLQSMGSQRVGHDCETFFFLYWKTITQDRYTYTYMPPCKISYSSSCVKLWVNVKQHQDRKEQWTQRWTGISAVWGQVPNRTSASHPPGPCVHPVKWTVWSGKLRGHLYLSKSTMWNHQRQFIEVCVHMNSKGNSLYFSPSTYRNLKHYHPFLRNHYRNFLLRRLTQEPLSWGFHFPE